jgi:hypothetical protein
MDQTIARAVSTSTAFLLCSQRVSRRECGAWCIFPQLALIVKLPQNSPAPSNADSALIEASSYLNCLLAPIEQPVSVLKCAAALTCGYEQGINFIKTEIKNALIPMKLFGF